MPLAFESRSHGTIAFGFFHIETDMLLLEDLFFFADSFCDAVPRLLTEVGSARIDGWRIADRAQVGNLHGAIGGVDHSGFIGALYRQRPFPEAPEDFKQDPDGYREQAWAAAEIAPFGQPLRIELTRDERGAVSIRAFEFTAEQFQQLVGYVVRGGYPRWRDDAPPSYVNELLAALLNRAPDRP